MIQTTLSFLVKEGEVLLAMKKRGFGVGKWNGIGGKLKEREKTSAAAVREIKEEIGVQVLLKDLKTAGALTFRYKDDPEWDQICNIFVIEKWKGEPAESDEMKPQWYAISELPFDAMWTDDPHWLPKVLAGKRIKGEFTFIAKGSELVNFAVSEVTK